MLLHIITLTRETSRDNIDVSSYRYRYIGGDGSGSNGLEKDAPFLVG
jgi:hypothetical protein